MSTIVDMNLPNDMERLGQQIYKARKQRGLQQAELAELVPVRRQVIGEIEHGTYKGSLKRVLDIMRAMGLRLTVEPVRFPTLDELSDE
jgi:DNA-binding XRE family transcriptional regulator